MKHDALTAALRQERIISSHSHHLPDPDHAALNLQGLLENSYVSWCTPSIPDGTSRAAVDAWLGKVRTRSYFVLLERALMELYQLPARLCFDTWPDYDAAIRAAHADPDHHLKLLRENCGYDSILLDAFWKPGDDNGHPELFRPAFRVNSFFYGHSSEGADHNGNNARLLYGIEGGLEEYLAFLDAEMERRRRSGAPVVKCALAYDRSLFFAPADRTRAARAFMTGASEQDIAAFQNYLFRHICRRAGEIGVPVQVHTGLGIMRDSRAMSLQPVIAENPGTTFILMHGSYPWTADIAGLTHVYSNVWADLCWLPMISGAAAERFLHELLDVCNADRIIWGCDTWTGEESYGARSACLELLGRVFARRIEDGRMDAQDALRLGRMILRENAARLL